MTDNDKLIMNYDVVYCIGATERSLCPVLTRRVADQRAGRRPKGPKGKVEDQRANHINEQHHDDASQTG